MPKLRLLHLKCNETTDGAGDDDVFINVNGVRVWGIVEMGEGTTAHPGSEVQFHTRAVIDVWEYDSGSDNDLIGETTATAGQVNQGEISVSMSGDDSDYVLQYEVVDK
jgi:hypothetical protein